MDHFYRFYQGNYSQFWEVFFKFLRFLYLFFGLLKSLRFCLLFDHFIRFLYRFSLIFGAKDYSFLSQVDLYTYFFIAF